ncbi:MAG: bifunctional DNA-formamidopyrimidine glycosylase/DNA-(apurinic or apyrimidinic site) lyase [Actinomycetota bacterium]|nr:bifunctional DNA-formamidopyrimidine glycosylase/DNA-(apurinic or apyrimidinic site) lyase [Actinomycetota bacterium]MDH5278598.1 bifunctional DNA-formamidopyrimidine glycosylase/DNA-(apurinic or apyrimidinic site) lyase [Actinomycetota bacterium]
MPELPEVESVRRGLVDHLAGRRVTEVEVCHPRAVRRHPAGAADLRARLVGRRLGEPARRGKYLWVPVADDDQALVAHLGMSGQFRIVDPGSARHPHVRAVLGLSDGQELWFVDQRTFGGLAVEPVQDGVPCSVTHIALDPFDARFDLAATVDRMRRRRTEVKRALLDQTLVSGVGNIYADEALWRSRLHPRRPTAGLTRAQARSVLVDARAVMSEALAVGGTSFDALYVDVNGGSGYFARSLSAYGREGQPCDRCGTPIRREAFANRSSAFCPACQRAPRRSPGPPSLRLRRSSDRGRVRGSRP